MNIAVIGAGASGLMAAYGAACRGGNVTVFEKNEKAGKKIYITGKGRCNVTNACDIDTYMDNVMSGARFMYASFMKLPPEKLMELVEKGGTRLKVERGRRVFPVSDHASDITAALLRLCEEEGVHLRLNTEVTTVRRETERETEREEERETEQEAFHGMDKSELMEATGLREATGPREAAESDENRSCSFCLSLRTGREGTKKREETFRADAVIVCTGGLCYPSTGSDGAGYRIAEAFGIGLNPCTPALAPLLLKEDVRELSGISLRNVAVRVSGKNDVKQPGDTESGNDPETQGRRNCAAEKKEKAFGRPSKKLYEEQGEVTFTQRGLGGPLGLTISSLLCSRLREGEEFTLSIDLKPALDLKQLDARILRDFEKAGNRTVEEALAALLIQALRRPVLRQAGINPSDRVQELTKAGRTALANAVKGLCFTVTGTAGFAEAIITRGGIRTDELSSSTMESKKINGLYFAGECVDVDCLTGGYNLQTAFSTGYLAGISAAARR